MHHQIAFLGTELLIIQHQIFFWTLFKMLCSTLLVSLLSHNNRNITTCQKNKLYSYATHKKLTAFFAHLKFFVFNFHYCAMKTCWFSFWESSKQHSLHLFEFDHLVEYLNDFLMDTPKQPLRAFLEKTCY